VRKTTDVIIATFCIAENHTLLFADRDFQPFVEHLGLHALAVCEQRAAQPHGATTETVVRGTEYTEDWTSQER
jgi:hypothetical protein